MQKSKKLADPTTNESSKIFATHGNRTHTSNRCFTGESDYYRQFIVLNMRKPIFRKMGKN